MESLPKLKLIATCGMRNAGIDMEAAQARGIRVTGTYGAPPTAELAFGLILSLARSVPQESRNMRAGGWQITIGRSLKGSTLGLLGLGLLGGQVAGFARAFGMKLIAWSQNMTAETAAKHGAQLVDKAALVRQSDFLSIHVVLSDRTRGLIGADDLRAMKRTAYIVNTARGPIIDEDALLVALQDRWIAGAGLDVFGTEPLPVNHPMRQLDNAILTPHLGYAARSVLEDFYQGMVECIRAWLAGEDLRVIV
jgi:D-3-phosphoglycerate dehydrogenase